MDLQSPLKREAGVIFLSLPGATSFVSLVLWSGLVWVPVWISNLDMSLVSILIQSFVLTCSVNQAATFPGVLLSKVLYFKH